MKLDWLHWYPLTKINVGENLILDGENIGYVVACKYSPLLEKYIGNAYVTKACAASGAIYQSASQDKNVNIISAPQIVGQSYLDMI